MILLDLRVHGAGINHLCGIRIDPSRISFERHAAFRAVTRLIAFDPRTHRAEIFGGGRSFYGSRVLMVAGLMVVIMLVMLGSAAVVSTGVLRRRVRFLQKFGAAMIAAEGEGLAVAFRSESGTLVDFHAADRISRHRVPFPNVECGCLHLPKQTHDREKHYTP